MKKHIPNLFTLANLLCGCLAILAVVYTSYNRVALLVVLAAVFDFLDGFLARMLKAYSPLGKQLDSLADMVTFGVVPGMVMYHLMLQSNFFVLFENRMLFQFFKIFKFVVTLFSALRLAKFNIDERQTSYFLGLATPANTLFIVFLPVILLHDEFGLKHLILNPLTLFGIAAIFSSLMVSEFPLFALKFKSFGWSENKGQYLLLVGSVVLFITLRYAAVPAIIVFYIILSILFPPAKTNPNEISG